jgi:3-hydroxyacyl-CoA dehydrogenase/enoyl-CoA hydratase/3-hydroxybutyryl-CoA epimerase
MTAPPEMHEFRTKITKDGICHLIFDAPGRAMNVFSKRAIREAEDFADWLKTSNVLGVVVRSGKPTAFCAGADLGELSTAYDMIMATPKEDRDQVCLVEFSPIGRAFRKLETAGKPVAAAIHGLALGGGCELVLACHYRVMTTAPNTQIGLPESLVGLLPGGGGTQRLPRLVGIAESLAILLDGGRFGAEAALAAKAADAVVAPGEEIATAEAWIRSAPAPVQPWDRDGWTEMNQAEITAGLDPERRKILEATGGHYPAPLAILDCLYRGLPVGMDQAVAEEMDVFVDLVQRIEPRNMIQVQFLGRVDYDKRRRKEALPERLDEFVTNVKATLAGSIQDRDALGVEAAAFAGITPDGDPLNWDAAMAADAAARDPQWFENPKTPIEKTALAILADAAMAAGTFSHDFSEEDRNMADYAACRYAGFPAYLGGPFTFLAYFGLPKIMAFSR